MANYDAVYRSNWFSVSNHDVLKEWVKNYLPDAILKESNDKYAFYGEGSFCFYDNKTDEDTILQKLQTLLKEEEAVVITEIGHEKINDLTAYSIIITKNDVDYISLYDYTIETVRKMLKNPKYLMHI